MFGLGVPELILILVVVLLIFGPRKLPELGSFVGRSLRDFREALDKRDNNDPPGPAGESHRTDGAGPEPVESAETVDASADRPDKA